MPTSTSNGWVSDESTCLVDYLAPTYLTMYCMMRFCESMMVSKSDNLVNRRENSRGRLVEIGRIIVWESLGEWWLFVIHIYKPKLNSDK